MKAMATYNRYTAEQQDFLRTHCKEMSRQELAERFNAEFGTTKTARAIKSYCNLRGWNAGSDGRFQNGNRSWQTGLSKDEFKSHYSDDSFRKMTRPMMETQKKWRIGDETMRHGFPMIVTSIDYTLPFCKRLTFKRRYVWEQAHGPIPPGHRIIHLDGDPLNCELDNLYCIPDKMVPVLNKNHWLTGDREHTLAAIKLCELAIALNGAVKI